MNDPASPGVGGRGTSPPCNQRVNRCGVTQPAAGSMDWGQDEGRLGQPPPSVPMPIRGVLGPRLESTHYSRKEHGGCFPTVFWLEASQLCSLSHCLVCVTSLPQMSRYEITDSAFLLASLGQMKAERAPQIRELRPWAFEALDRPPQQGRGGRLGGCCHRSKQRGRESLVQILWLLGHTGKTLHLWKAGSPISKRGGGRGAGGGERMLK